MSEQNFAKYFFEHLKLSRLRSFSILLLLNLGFIYDQSIKNFQYLKVRKN